MAKDLFSKCMVAQKLVHLKLKRACVILEVDYQLAKKFFKDTNSDEFINSNVEQSILDYINSSPNKPIKEWKIVVLKELILLKLGEKQKEFSSPSRIQNSLKQFEKQEQFYKIVHLLLILSSQVNISKMISSYIQRVFYSGSTNTSIELAIQQSSLNFSFKQNPKQKNDQKQVSLNAPISILNEHLLNDSNINSHNQNLIQSITSQLSTLQLQLKRNKNEVIENEMNIILMAISCSGFLITNHEQFLDIGINYGYKCTHYLEKFKIKDKISLFAHILVKQLKYQISNSCSFKQKYHYAKEFIERNAEILEDVIHTINYSLDKIQLKVQQYKDQSEGSMVLASMNNSQLKEIDSKQEHNNVMEYFTMSPIKLKELFIPDDSDSSTNYNRNTFLDQRTGNSNTNLIERNNSQREFQITSLQSLTEDLIDETSITHKMKQKNEYCVNLFRKRKSNDHLDIIEQTPHQIQNSNNINNNHNYSVETFLHIPSNRSLISNSSTSSKQTNFKQQNSLSTLHSSSISRPQSSGSTQIANKLNLEKQKSLNQILVFDNFKLQEESNKLPLQVVTVNKSIQDNQFTKKQTKEQDQNLQTPSFQCSSKFQHQNSSKKSFSDDQKIILREKDENRGGVQSKENGDKLKQMSNHSNLMQGIKKFINLQSYKQQCQHKLNPSLDHSNADQESQLSKSSSNRQRRKIIASDHTDSVSLNRKQSSSPLFKSSFSNLSSNTQNIKKDKQSQLYKINNEINPSSSIFSSRCSESIPIYNNYQLNQYKIKTKNGSQNQILNSFYQMQMIQSPLGTNKVNERDSKYINNNNTTSKINNSQVWNSVLAKNEFEYNFKTFRRNHFSIKQLFNKKDKEQTLTIIKNNESQMPKQQQISIKDSQQNHMKGESFKNKLLVLHSEQASAKFQSEKLNGVQSNQSNILLSDKSLGQKNVIKNNNLLKRSQFADENMPPEKQEQLEQQEQERTPFLRKNGSRKSMVEKIQQKLNISDKELLKKTILHSIRSTYIGNQTHHNHNIPFPLIPEETESVNLTQTPKQNYKDTERKDENVQDNYKLKSRFNNIHHQIKQEDELTHANYGDGQQNINSQQQSYQSIQEQINTPLNLTTAGDMSNIAQGTTISWEGISSPERSNNIFNRQQNSIPDSLEGSPPRTPKKKSQRTSFLSPPNQRRQISFSQLSPPNCFKSKKIIKLISSSRKSTEQSRFKRLNSFSDVRQFYLTPTDKNQPLTTNKLEYSTKKSGKKCSTMKRQTSLPLSPAREAIPLAELLISPFDYIYEPYNLETTPDQLKTIKLQLNPSPIKKKLSQQELLKDIQPLRFIISPLNSLDFVTCTMKYFPSLNIIRVIISYAFKGVLKYDIHYDPMRLIEDIASPTHVNNHTPYSLISEYFERDLLKRQGIEAMNDFGLLVACNTLDMRISQDRWVTFNKKNKTTEDIYSFCDVEGILGLLSISQHLYHKLIIQSGNIGKKLIFKLNNSNNMNISYNNNQIMDLSTINYNQNGDVQIGFLRFAIKIKKVIYIVTSQILLKGSIQIALQSLVHSLNSKEQHLLSYCQNISNNNNYPHLNNTNRECLSNSQLHVQIEQQRQEELLLKLPSKKQSQNSYIKMMLQIAPQILFPKTNHQEDQPFFEQQPIKDRYIGSSLVNLTENDENCFYNNINNCSDSNLQKQKDKLLFEQMFKDTLSLFIKETTFFDIGRSSHSSHNHFLVQEQSEIIANHEQNSSSNKNRIISDSSSQRERVIRFDVHEKHGIRVNIKLSLEKGIQSENGKLIKNNNEKQQQCIKMMVAQRHNKLRFYETYDHNLTPIFTKRKQITKLSLFVIYNKILKSHLPQIYSHLHHTLTSYSLVRQPSLFQSLLLSLSPSLSSIGYQSKCQFLYKTTQLGRISVEVHSLEMKNSYFGLCLVIQQINNRVKQFRLVLNVNDINQLIKCNITRNSSHLTSQILQKCQYIQALLSSKICMSLDNEIYSNQTSSQLNISSIKVEHINATEKSSEHISTIPCLLKKQKIIIQTLFHFPFKLNNYFVIISLQYDHLVNCYFLQIYFPSTSRKLHSIIEPKQLFKNSSTSKIKQSSSFVTQSSLNKQLSGDQILQSSDASSFLDQFQKRENNFQMKEMQEYNTNKIFIMNMVTGKLNRVIINNNLSKLSLNQNINVPLNEHLFSCIVGEREEQCAYSLQFYCELSEIQKSSANCAEDFPSITFATSEDTIIKIRCTQLNYKQYLIASFNLRSLLNLQIAEGFFKHLEDYTHSKLFLSDIKELCQFIALKVNNSDFPELCSLLPSLKTNAVHLSQEENLKILQCMTSHLPHPLSK